MARHLTSHFDVLFFKFLFCNGGVEFDVSRSKVMLFHCYDVAC